MSDRGSLVGSLVILMYSHTALCSDDMIKTGLSNEVTKTYIEELTVIGKRDKETLSDESHSVALFNREALDLATQRNFNELFERIPNASTDTQGESVVRGIPQFGINNGVRGAASTTTFFRDGLGALIQPVLWDANTAEVSRGPQNKLRPSVGGILAVGTSDPTARPSGRARLSWAPDGNDRELGIAVSGPLTDTWSARISGYSRTDDGHFENLTLNDDEWNRQEERLGRAKLLWQPSPTTTVKLLGEYTKRRRGGGSEVRGSINDPAFDPFDREAVADVPGITEETAVTAIVDVTHDLHGPWLLNLAVGWNDLDADAQVDGDGTSVPGSAFQTLTNFEAYGFVFVALYEQDDWVFRFRQRLSHFDSELVQNNISPFDLDGPGALPGIITNTQVVVPWPDFYGWTTQLSIMRNFGRLRFSASLSYEGDTTGEDFSALTSIQETTGIPALDETYAGIVQNFFPQIVAETDTDSADLLPMLSLSYSLDDSTIVGVKWERARRAGGVTINIARRQLSTYEPESADNFDVFLRATRFDQRLSFAANAFYTRNEDLQLNAVLSTAPQDNQIVNAERSTTEGIELSLSWIDSRWTAFATIGFLRTELENASVGLSDFSGNEYPFAPRWSASLGGAYNPQVGFFAAFDLVLQDDAEATFDNRPGTRSESRTLLNARIGWRWEKLSLSMYGRNLLDDEYFNAFDRDIPFGQQQVFNPGDPREVGVTLELNW